MRTTHALIGLVVATSFLFEAYAFVPSNPAVVSRIRRPLLPKRLAERVSDDDGALSDDEAVTVEPSSVSVVSSELERFFFDRCEIRVRGGNGGLGALGSVGARAAGGNGGNGGPVYIECDPALNTLDHLPGRKYRGAKGGDGFRRTSGETGAPCVVKVPPNTIVTDRDTNETLCSDLARGARVLLCAGGRGGKGNGASGKKDKVAPPGPGAARSLALEMTLVADVGLVGLPNAGKSSLIRAVTSARPKVANYPFTTLIPNLGVCSLPRYRDAATAYGAKPPLVLLDIPGLIEGAAAGKGLGRAFLRHTERCRVLLHLVDGESADPVASLAAINRELARYSTQLAAKPQAVVLTKADLPHVQADLQAKLTALHAATPAGRVMAVSSLDGTALETLLKRTRALLDHTTAQQEARRLGELGEGGDDAGRRAAAGRAASSG